MKKILTLVLSHVAVLAVGYGIHHMAVATQARHTPPAVEAASPRRPSSPVQALAPSSTGIRPGEERKTLAAIRDSQLNQHQKRFLRDQILRDWLARDPHMALRMMAEEESTPNNNDFRNFITTAVVKGREEEMLGWIMNGDFGLNGADILRCWSAQVGQVDAALLLKLLPKVPDEFQKEALDGIFHSSIDPSQLEHRIALIPTIADDQVRSLAWKAALAGAANGPAGQMEDPTRFLALMAREDVPQEARAEGLNRFAHGLMTNKSQVEAMKFFSMLPAEDQASMAKDLMKAARSGGVFNSSAYLSALTMVSASGQWEVIAKDGPGLIDQMYQRHPGNAPSASRWAQELPARSEVVPTYRRILGGMFKQESVEQANTWIEALPDGWHKDQAYAQLAITAEHHYKSPEQRDAAISKVKDPGIRSDLDVWRQGRKK